MANESTAAAPIPVDAASVPSTAALSPAERSRLMRCFQTGTQALQSNQSNPDYAVDMFAACVVGDPGNAVFLQAFLGALKKKFAGRKAGSLTSFFSAGSRAMLKKLASSAQWRDVIKQGVEIVKNNPSDHTSLLAMAEACGNLMFPDAQAFYLRAALDASPADPEVNKQCARFAANQGHFDQAIECWRRISRTKGLAEESEREIARLSVEKTIVAGQGMVGRGAPKAAAAKPDEQAQTGGRIAELRQAIQRNPADIESYLELADLLERDAKVDEAERVLHTALDASGNELKVREHLEDRQIRWAKHKVLIAEKRLAADDTPDNRTAVERLRAAQLKQEIEVFASRCERYPENLTWKFELAMRLKVAGNHAEAIRNFQETMKDTRRRGAVALELGECFQKIKQYQLAMQNYQTAVEALGDREMELRKRALYRAGVLATGLEDVDAAKKYLSTLAGLDFGYRDVAQRLERLDKSAPANDNGGEG